MLHLGYRMQWNKGPQGPANTTYFLCPHDLPTIDCHSFDGGWCATPFGFSLSTATSPMPSYLEYKFHEKERNRDDLG